MPVENKTEASVSSQTPEPLTDDSLSPDAITGRKTKSDLQKDIKPEIHQAVIGPSNKNYLPENLERDMQRRERNENIRLQDYIRPDVPREIEIFVHPRPVMIPGPPNQISSPSTEVGAELEGRCSRLHANKYWIIGGVLLGITAIAVGVVLYVTQTSGRNTLSESNTTTIIEQAFNTTSNITDTMNETL